VQQNPYAAPAAGAYGAPQGGAAGSTDNYEFNAVENETIAKLARRARTWGVFSAIGGILGCLGMLLALGGMGMAMGQLRGEEAAVLGAMFAAVGLIAAPRVIGLVVIGLRYIKAGKSLDLVVSTEGNDVALAVDATENMGKAFWLDFWINMITIILVVVGIIVMFAGIAMVA